MPAAFYFAVALSGLLLMLFAARIPAVKLFLKRVWSGIESALHALGHFPSVVLRYIDKGLIWLSRPFLTRPAKTFRRHAAARRRWRCRPSRASRRATRRRGESPTSTRWPGSARPPSSASATSSRRCPTPTSRPALRGVLLDKVADMRKVVDVP